MRILLLIIISLQVVSGQSRIEIEIFETLKPTILAEARWAMQQEPVTVTAVICKRSAGGKHDFYSEGDYWWPDPENSQGPYIQKDGQTNPENFIEHRHAMIRFSKIVGALTSAYILTHEKIYVDQIVRHCKAWFIDSATYMNPSLNYAQAIKGRVTGRGIGIIDTIHLMEVAQGVYVLQRSGLFDQELLRQIKGWFEKYLVWLTTHEYGKAEMNAENNHGTCWVMQVAAFARLTGNTKILSMCRDRYKNVLLPNQMGEDGSFPRELKRTKPYGYSLFNLDAMVMVCHILSAQEDNLWAFKTQDGRSIKKGIEFLFPFVEDKTKWIFVKDVMYWEKWPVAHPFLVFGAIAFDQPGWITTWKQFDHNPSVDEVIRNLPIRNPIIWL